MTSDTSSSYTPGGKAPDWSKLPPDTAQSLRQYIEGGYHPGGFLQAVLSNNLAESIKRADKENLASLADIVAFLSTYAPGDCWGSADRFEAWTEKGGLNSA